MLLSGQGEIAFVVIEAYQAQGIGTLLMRHLRVLARDAGIKALIAEVQLPVQLTTSLQVAYLTLHGSDAPGAYWQPLSQPEQRSAIAAAARFLPTNKASVEAARISPLPL